MSGIQPSLGSQFSDDLNVLAGVFEKAANAAEEDIIREHRIIAERWRSEAVERVPVDTSTLKQRIVANTYREAGHVVSEVGTNVKYGKYVEFGTERIAKGRVLRLGFGPEITDHQAVLNWPAKNNDLVDPDTGKANMRALNAIAKRRARGRMEEQMPWLRPAFNHIREWAIDRLSRLFGRL